MILREKMIRAELDAEARYKRIYFNIWNLLKIIDGNNFFEYSNLLN